MSAGPVRAVICDLDGTLVDSLDSIAMSMQIAVANHLPGRVVPDLRPHIGPPLRAMLVGLWPDVSPELCERIVEDFTAHYDSRGCLQALPFRGVEETLSTLASRGARLFVLTNKRWLPTDKMLRHLSWATFFTGVQTLDLEAPALPSKAAAAEVLCARFGIEPAAALLVGDTGEDHAVALARGFHFVHAAYGYGDTCDGCRSIGRFPELAGVVSTLNGAVQ